MRARPENLPPGQDPENARRCLRYLTSQSHLQGEMLDPTTGLVIHEDRFLKAMWPQVAEIHDLHFGPAQGTFFTAVKALSLEQRFPPPKPKRKKKMP